jgi:hypothetical protein
MRRFAGECRVFVKKIKSIIKKERVIDMIIVTIEIPKTTLTSTRLFNRVIFKGLLKYEKQSINDGKQHSDHN